MGIDHLMASLPPVLDLNQGMAGGCSPNVPSSKMSRTVNQETLVMAKIDDLIPSAKEIQKQAALKEAQKADEHAKRLAAAEAEKRALIDKLSQPSGLSEEEKVQLASTVIQRAVRNGLTEVQVYRFPNSLCTDRGRAINQMEKGWEKTLTGIPKEIYQLWSDYLQPRGYRIRYQIIDFPGGMPGDISITINWDG
jgi:uncharacterized protein (DUF1778 family)